MKMKAGGKASKSKKTKANKPQQKKSAPKAAKQKTVKPPKKISTAVRKKTVKAPPKKPAGALKTSKTTTPGKKNVKPKPVMNAGAAGPSPKPIKTTTPKIKPPNGILGTLKNTGQTSAKKGASKRKQDQPKQAFLGNKIMRMNTPAPAQIRQSNPVYVIHSIPVPSYVPVQYQENYSHPQREIEKPFQPHHQLPSKVTSVPDGKAEVHFVDKHREALIRNVTPVEPILDTLMSEELLNHEQYDTICSELTSQKKMRELCRYIKGFGNDDKDKFYEALKKHNAPHIQALEDA